MNDGDEQGESGPITVTNQTYTVSGGGGMITSVSAPEGYTVDTKIPAAGVGTVRITGNSETSFALGVSLYFPQTAAGDDTVTCDGTLTLSNGQTVNSSPSGSAQVAAVAVDSVSLAGSPSSYTIGEAMSRSDFNITTTPSGYGNYQYPETEQYLVTLLPATFNIAVGDNPVVASCGASEASYDLTAAEVSANWGTYTKGNGAPPDTAAFTVESLGEPGSFNVTGQYVVGGGDGGPLLASTPVDGDALIDPVSDTADPSAQSDIVGAQINVSADALIVQQFPSSAPAAVTAGPGAVAPPAAVAGLLGPLGKLVFNRVKPALVPGVKKLTIKAAAVNPAGWNQAASSATVTIITSGVGVNLVGPVGWIWTDSPGCVIQVAEPSPATVAYTNKAGQVLKFNFGWDAISNTTNAADQAAFDAEDDEPKPNTPAALWGNAVATSKIIGAAQMRNAICIGLLVPPPGWALGPNANWNVTW